VQKKSLNVIGPKLSLRERNKLATRDALAEAAVVLAARFGLQELKIEDIAAEAGVSTRTFSNYFSNKYEAITARHVGRMRHAAEALRAWPADEPLWDAIIGSILVHWQQTNDAAKAPEKKALLELRLLFGDRNLQGEILSSGMATDNPYAAAIAERIKVDVYSDLYPRLVAAAVMVVTQIALNEYLYANPPVALLPLLMKSLDELSRGFPDPTKKALKPK
jgi:AcrR family transcriptional regulator